MTLVLNAFLGFGKKEKARRKALAGQQSTLLKTAIHIISGITPKLNLTLKYEFSIFYGNNRQSFKSG